jgi:membrane-associated phospholipid phosphatase
MLATVGCAPLTPIWPGVLRADDAVLTQVVLHRRTAWRRPAARVTEVAAPAVVMGVVAAAAVYARRREVSAASIRAPVSAAGFGIGLRRALAATVHRDRPTSAWWWSEPSGFSYPSRHVTWAVLGFGAAADLLAAAGAAQCSVRVVRVAPAAVVAATRVLLAVHWPSDVGAAVAFSVAYRELVGSRSATKLAGTRATR